MENINLNIEKTLDFISKEKLASYEPKVKACMETLEKGTGLGNDFLGWLHLPSSITKEHLDDLKATAQTLRENCDVVIVAGIGGSYLGARAVIEAMSNSFAWLQEKKAGQPTIIFAGHNISEDYLFELTEFLKDKKFGVINISKSGTTTETALAFRLLKKQCEDQRGKEMARKVIVAVTDAKKGAARTTADKEGYKSFIIPDNVGGRFSVLTPVGLLPIAVAGIDIDQLVAGACEMEKVCANENMYENPAALYAATRNELYQSGKKIEILVNFQPKLHYFMEWWKQLYGESEGKDQKGLFPASVDLTTDLHSMGQFIQDGSRIMFETVMNVEKSRCEVTIQKEDVDLDGLNYLAGKTMDFVNKSAMNGTILAHTDGNVPNLMVKIPEQNEFYLGELFYFFEFACGVSGYLLGINPFNQPGVESYKKNMFALLGKPGYEDMTAELQKRL